MSDADAFETDAAVRAAPRPAVDLFVNDGDRAFLYRVAALHAAAGIAPAASMRAASAALSDGPQEPGAAGAAIARRVAGALRLAEGIEGARDGETVAQALGRAKFHLGALERACLSVPASALGDPSFSSALFGALADLSQGERAR